MNSLFPNAMQTAVSCTSGVAAASWWGALMPPMLYPSAALSVWPPPFAAVPLRPPPPQLRPRPTCSSTLPPSPRKCTAPRRPTKHGPQISVTNKENIRKTVEEEEEEDLVDEDNDAFLEDLTTPAIEFPMPVWIPSLYVRKGDQQYKTMVSLTLSAWAPLLTHSGTAILKCTSSAY
jgi:hypothetical protein